MHDRNGLPPSEFNMPHGTTTADVDRRFGGYEVVNTERETRILDRILDDAESHTGLPVTKAIDLLQQDYWRSKLNESWRDKMAEALAPEASDLMQRVMDGNHNLEGIAIRIGESLLASAKVLEVSAKVMAMSALEEAVRKAKANNCKPPAADPVAYREGHNELNTTEIERAEWDKRTPTPTTMGMDDAPRNLLPRNDP